jgi:hypothetical protein
VRTPAAAKKSKLPAAAAPSAKKKSTRPERKTRPTS